MAKPMLPLPDIAVQHHGKTIFPIMQEWWSQKRLSPVLLLTGTTGVGKRPIACFLAQWILCEKTGLNQLSSDANECLGSFSPLPCGGCLSCRRAISGTWVDFSEVIPSQGQEELESTAFRSVKIEQIRALRVGAGFGAHEGKYKIILIPHADRMTLQAANAALKLLEEPPKGWIFFLTANDPMLVLPTVLSRCQRLRLKPFPMEDIELLLRKAGSDSDRIKICASLAQGSWGKALALSETTAWERRLTFFNFLLDPRSSLHELVDWSSQSSSRFEMILDQLESILGDLVAWSIQAESMDPEHFPWINSDGKIALMSHIRRAKKEIGSVTQARKFWLRQAELVAQCREGLLAPLNRKILAQTVLIPWIELAAGEAT